MKTEKKITLSCKEGGSSKQYTLWLQEEKGGWTVQFQYGPIGGWVKDGTKTPKPVPFADAEKIYSKLMTEKKVKGYAEGEDAPAFSQTAGAVDSGLRPMLLTPDDESNVDKYISDDDWIAQQKINGKRVMVKATADGVIGVNRRGLECPIPEEVRLAFKGVVGVFDGELIGTEYHVFDVLAAEAGELRSQGIETRETEGHAVLRESKSVVWVPTIHGRSAKRTLYERLKKGRKEGIVFKRLDVPYEPGRRDDLKKAICVKVKFWAEGNFSVIDWNGDKQSVSIAALGAGKEVRVGSVAVPSKYSDQVAPGKVLRVRYLYATANDILYQPKLDPTDDGVVTRDVNAEDVCITKVSELKHEGKEESDD